MPCGSLQRSRSPRPSLLPPLHPRAEGPHPGHYTPMSSPQSQSQSQKQPMVLGTAPRKGFPERASHTRNVDAAPSINSPSISASHHTETNATDTFSTLSLSLPRLQHTETQRAESHSHVLAKFPWERKRDFAHVHAHALGCMHVCFSSAHGESRIKN